MCGNGPLHLETDFFGADEAITSFSATRSCWVATLIVSGQDLPSVQKKRRRILGKIRDHCGAAVIEDEGPPERRGKGDP